VIPTPQTPPGPQSAFVVQGKPQLQRQVFPRATCVTPLWGRRSFESTVLKLRSGIKYVRKAFPELTADGVLAGAANAATAIRRTKDTTSDLMKRLHRMFCLLSVVNSPN
jgi:hypothetical protein